MIDLREKKKAPIGSLVWELVYSIAFGDFLFELASNHQRDARHGAVGTSGFLLGAIGGPKVPTLRPVLDRVVGEHVGALGVLEHG
jgi:hypothetical protein